MKTIAIILMLLFAWTASASVFINEIAWMGTEADPNGHYCEWIELINTGPDSVNLNGWTLSIGSTTEAFNAKNKATLSIAPAPNNFYLIERFTESACPDPVPGIPADWSVSFGRGISNSATVISLKDDSGGPVDTVVASDGWKIDGVVAGNNTTKETAQRGASGWGTGTPTPRAANIGATSAPIQESSTNTSQSNTTPTNPSFPVEPQIFADAGASMRTVSSGAPITFTGRAFGLKKEPIENARMIWAFGDVGRAEGVSVAHTYYYPGDYVVVLDVASGYYSASDRATVRVTAPLITLSVGGDQTRSFVTLENSGVEEIDLSEWQIASNGKILIFPKNTILSARKTLTLASEVTGLVTPVGSVAELRFPNGTRVETQNDISAPTSQPAQAPSKEHVVEKPNAVQVVASSHNSAPRVLAQEASASDAFVGNVASSSVQESGSMWPWYSGSAFLGALALLGLRMTREKKIKNSSDLTADDFEIIEDEEEDKKDSIF